MTRKAWTRSCGLPAAFLPTPDVSRWRWCRPLTRWKEHDAYQKALDRLLRDLRVEKA